MPLRKSSSNGGWQRISMQHLKEEKEEIMLQQQQQHEEEKEAIDERIRQKISAGIQKHSTKQNDTVSADQADWVTEGRRRVRCDQVQRNMAYLTGMAAIGGFLFGYDTGKKRRIECSKVKRIEPFLAACT
jgi:hypothetical protein